MTQNGMFRNILCFGLELCDMYIDEATIWCARSTGYWCSRMPMTSAYLFSRSRHKFSNFACRNLKKIVIRHFDRQNIFSWNFSKMLRKHSEGNGNINLDDGDHIDAILRFLRRVPDFMEFFKHTKSKSMKYEMIFENIPKIQKHFLKIRKWHKRGDMHRKTRSNWYPAVIKNIFEFWVSNWRLFFLQK